MPTNTINPGLENLAKKRCAHLKSCAENKDYSHALLADIYKEPTRFLYEILQNADDVGATSVSFVLEKASLSVKHDGKDFTYENVDSITTFHSSKDDSAIGHFGIGFKSVFSITDAPHIHSGCFHFKIRDLIVPYPVCAKDCMGKTIFEFPFHADGKKKFPQIEEKFKSMGAECLLFLQNVRKIEWEFPGMQRHVEKQETAIVKKSDPAAKDVSCYDETGNTKKYLVFERNVRGMERVHGSPKLQVAYQLDEKEYAEVADEKKIFCFFATNEDSYLDFLVQAPYEPTKDREGIDFSSEGNQTLTEQLAELSADSLSVLKAKKPDFLNMKFLALLPLNEGQSSESHHPYRKIFENVKNKLQKEALLPLHGGGHGGAGDCVLADNEALMRLLDEQDLKQLFSKCAWVEFPTGTLKTYLEKHVEVEKIDWEKFANAITDEFLQKKSNKWFEALYQVLAKERVDHHFKKKSVIPLASGGFARPFGADDKPQVYLPGEAHDGSATLKIIESEVAKGENAQILFTSWQISQPDMVAVVKEIIAPKYHKDEIQVTMEEYRADMRRLADFWQNASFAQRGDIRSDLKNARIALTKNGNEPVWQSPSNVYFRNLRLEKWFANSPQTIFLDDPVFAAESDAHVREFLQYMGCKYDVRLDKTWRYKFVRHGCNEQADGQFNPNFTIDGFDDALRHITLDRSLILWEIMLKHHHHIEGRVQRASNRNDLNDALFEACVSGVGEKLRTIPWLFDNEGSLIAVEDMEHTSLTEMHVAYGRDDSETDPLIKALGMKQRIYTQEEYDEQIAQVKEESMEQVRTLEAAKSALQKKLAYFEKRLPAQPANEAEESVDHGWKPNALPDEVKSMTIQVDQYFPRSMEAVSRSSGSREKESEKETENVSSPKDSSAVGDWGERHVYDKLREKYANRKCFTVQWMNEHGDVRTPYDIKICQDGKDAIYVEVKATRCSHKEGRDFVLTGREWRLARQCHEQKGEQEYHVHVVFNAGKENETEDVKHLQIKDPVGLWRENKLYANPVQIILGKEILPE